MPQIRNTSFTAYVFTEEEMLEAVKLSPLQEQYMQTSLADTAEMLLALQFTPKDMYDFAQQEAYLRGQKEFIEFLLAQDSSIKLKEETERRLKEREAEDKQSIDNGA